METPDGPVSRPAIDGDRARRPYRRRALNVRPAKLVPLDPEHERQGLAALTELLRALLVHEQDGHRT